MITVALFYSCILIALISFFIISKKNNPLTLIFLLLIIEYFFTSFISVIVDDAKLWTVSKGTRFFIMFRVAEVVIFPLMLLWYIEAIKRWPTFSKKLLLSVLWVLLLVGIEAILIQIKIFKYEKWEVWGSILVWYVFLLFINILVQVFSKIIYKEGIRR